ncbi:uncharacterized protein LOC122577454 [Bombus pyrosoma]|uniref:uncharacterized protein LOC122577454 n=1 Tax=Bombus pyrosoma TaxID=396416 RepID=UPI001CB903A8|nr:uncharacterized protein LOC122577454 [Bombus pyrosoma]
MVIKEFENFTSSPNMTCNAITKSKETRFDKIIELLRLEHLNEEERKTVEELIRRNQDRFHLPGETLEGTEILEHRIITTDDIPINVKQYRYPPAHREEITRQIQELLETDVVMPSTSPYNSPLWIVPKKPDSQGNKRWRLVIDYRKLNDKTIGDAYPLPNITEILDQLGSAKYFSTFDLASGFHQIRMAREDAHKTAFSTPYGHFQFKRMPFGLKNAPATFQRLMNSVLSGLQGVELFVYLDDIVIYSTSLQEHECKFNKLMERLRQAKLRLQPDKCELLRHEVSYLGHIISEDGVKPDPKKIEAVSKFPRPKKARNIKQFLGLAGYYRRFIPNFSKIAKPLTQLLKKDVIFKWSENQEIAFNNLKTALTTKPILQYPDFSKPFNLSTDASGYAVGGVLSQGPIGKDLPIAYASRLLNPAEQNYSTIEKECLAIVYCAMHFRPYLYGRKFTIVTDHKPLVWMNSIKDPTSRIWKWKLKLSDFEFDIQHKQGRANANADALSRNPPEVCLPIRKREEDSPSHHPIPKRFELDTSTEDSPIFEAKPRSLPLPFYDPRKKRKTIARKHFTIEETPVKYFDQAADDTDEASIQGTSNVEMTREEEISSPHSESPQRLEEKVKPTITAELKISETRDSIVKINDHKVIFIDIKGNPVDRGALEIKEAGKLPNYEDLMLERARLHRDLGKLIISLPVKENRNIPITTENLLNSLSSLLDVVNEKQLKSFGISKGNLEELPWRYIIRKLKEVFLTNTIHITICTGEVTIPRVENRNKIIQEKHESSVAGHKGVTKTYQRIRQHYYWENMKKEIQEYVRACKECQLKKLTRIKTKQPMVLTDTPGRAFDKISMDIVGPLPKTQRENEYILTIQDLLTKYSLGIPIKGTSSAEIADVFIKQFICRFGSPRAILTDQGANFTSSLIKKVAKKFRIKRYTTTAYHPQSNGSIERSHHVLKEYLKLYIENSRNWDEWVELAMFSYNTSVHEGTKFSPHELVFGHLAREPTGEMMIEENIELTYAEYLRDLFDKINTIQQMARENLMKSKLKSKEYYDRRINPQNFKTGDLVYLLKEPNKGKLSDQYSGPHKVLGILQNQNGSQPSANNKPN